MTDAELLPCYLRAGQPFRGSRCRWPWGGPTYPGDHSSWCPTLRSWSSRSAFWKQKTKIKFKLVESKRFWMYRSQISFNISTLKFLYWKQIIFYSNFYIFWKSSTYQKIVIFNLFFENFNICFGNERNIFEDFQAVFKGD